MLRIDSVWDVFDIFATYLTILYVLHSCDDESFPRLAEMFRRKWMRKALGKLVTNVNDLLPILGAFINSGICALAHQCMQDHCVKKLRSTEYQNYQTLL